MTAGQQVAGQGSAGHPAGTTRVAPPLVGRDVEINALVDVLTGIERSGFRCIAVTGEAGIGKTRLLDEALERTASKRRLILRGRATEFDQVVPFGLMIDALDRYLADSNVSIAGRVGDGYAAELAAIFPSLPRRGPPAVTTQAERYRCHYAIRLLIEQLAADCPLVLALDDVHWADEASVELIAHLLRRGFKHPVALILAYRARGAPHLLNRAVDSFARGDRLEAIELEPLTFDQAEKLLGPGTSVTVREALFEETGGNPFYLEQLSRTAAHTPSRRFSRADHVIADVVADVPSAVEASLLEEVERLSRPARTLLYAAAVTGEPFDPELAGEVARLRSDETLPALDELLDADVIRPTNIPRRFRFRHPIVARAIYASSGAGWRLAAHERAAAALHARNSPATTMAYHVEQSARRGDEEAIRTLTEAGEAATARAPGLAARWFHAALRLLGPEPSPRRLGLLTSLATAQASSGRLDAARTSLSEVLSSLPPGAVELRVHVITLLAQAEALLGHAGEARSLLVDALDSDALRPSARAALLLELASDRFRDRDIHAAASRAAEALDATRSGEDRQLEATALAQLAWVEYARGSISTARRHMRDAAELIDALPDDQLAGRLEGIMFLNSAESGLGYHQAAIAHGERGLALARATGRNFMIPQLMLGVIRAKIWTGQLDDASGAAQSLLDSSRLLGVDHFVAWAWFVVSWAAIARGDVAAAIHAGEKSAKAFEATPAALFSHLGRCILGYARVIGGEPDRGRDEIVSAAGGPELPAFEAGARAIWYEALVEAELALGSIDAAAAWIGYADAVTLDGELSTYRAIMCRARAQVRLAQDGAEEASVLARQAAGTFAEHGLRVEAARALIVLGASLRSLEETDQAVGVLERAFAELEYCGAERLRDAAAHELRRLARRIPRGGRRTGARGGLAGLTDREREVAELVTRGQTNRDIGAALFLSPRTIENHLTNIFRKLGVSSRAEVARELSRQELGDLERR
jgi:DNA-binding CsgD family transcriptional regulator/tetratricopeptide (TPR) repeat protein